MDNRQREMIHTLMNQHSKPMVQAAYRRIGDWHLAEDALKKEFSHAKSYLTFLFAISTKHSCFF